MGRRRGFLGTLVREMEKSANRSAADRRRQQRRSEGVQSRAFEREMVRYEREQERARVRAEREAERRRIARERESANQKKQDAKDAQLSAWRLEYEEHQEREQEIERIANESPEVEDRARLYSDLAERQVFEPEPFVPPIPPNTEAKAGKLRKTAEQEVEEALESFRPDIRITRQLQAIAGVIAVGGVGLFFVPETSSTSLPGGAFIVGALCVVILHLIANSQIKSQRDIARNNAQQETQAKLQKTLATLAREDAEQVKLDLDDARMKYEAVTTKARSDFNAEEDARLLMVQELGTGDTLRIGEALKSILPLELPVPCEARFTVESSTTIVLEIDVPEPSVVPTNDAKLLASGKVTYKEKNAKRIREQYLRLVTGLAIRHASEVMLNVPTCQCVQLRAFRTALDPSLGRPTRQPVLVAIFDYPTLAPLTMDGIDPVTALKHFKHQLKVNKAGELQAVDMSDA